MELKLSICFIVCCLVAAVAGQDSDGSPSLARQQFRPPKIFNFDFYTIRFNKHYPSLVEKLTRKKLFLARALRAFISIVGYKYDKLDYYLGLSNLSDKTRGELKRMLMWGPLTRTRDEPSDGGFGCTSEDQVADEEDIESTIEAIAKLKDFAPGFREAADELHSIESIARRKKRLASWRRNSIDVDTDLYPTERHEENLKTVHVVPSNNPKYQPIEGISFGSELSRDEPELSIVELNKLKGKNGSNFVKRATRRLASLFSSSSKNPKATGELDSASNEISETDDRGRHIVWVDHRRSKCFGPAKYQGDCASCYIFSTMALFEWHYCMATNKSVSFSEQYILDCGSKYHNLGGCLGGFERQVGEFIKTYGLQLTAHYPYSAEDGQCAYEDNVPPERMGYLILDKNIGLERVGPKEMAITLDKAPILFAVHVPEDLHEYKGGVHPGDNIEPADGLHSMLLVGDGIEDGNEYWLFRNSFGADWGEEGYLKINKRAPIWRGKGLALSSDLPDGGILHHNERHKKPEFGKSSQVRVKKWRFT